MNVVVLYQSLRGGTRRTANEIGQAAADQGATASVFPVTNFNYKSLAEADVVFIGTWTDGLFGIGSRPGQMSKLRSLPEFAGKNVAVFCSYEIRPTRVLRKLTSWAQSRGATVVGAAGFKRKEPGGGADDFVGEVLRSISADSVTA